MRHTMFSVAASGCHLVVEQFRSYSGSDEEAGPGKLSDLSEYLRNTIKVIRENLEDGYVETFSSMRRKHRSTWTSLYSRGCSGDR